MSFYFWVKVLIKIEDIAVQIRPEKNHGISGFWPNISRKKSRNIGSGNKKITEYSKKITEYSKKSRNIPLFSKKITKNHGI